MIDTRFAKEEPRLDLKIQQVANRSNHRRPRHIIAISGLNFKPCLFLCRLTNAFKGEGPLKVLLAKEADSPALAGEILG